MKCPETLARAFDEKWGRLDLRKVDISDASLAERAGTCSGKAFGVRVLDIALGGLTNECLEHFLRGFANSNALEILQAVTIGAGSFLDDFTRAEFLTSLVASPSLKSFSATDQRFRKSSADALLEVLASNPSLENLTLVNMPWLLLWAKLGDNLKKPGASASRITSSVDASATPLPHLKSLNISDDCLQADDIYKIVTPLVSLESLDISGNGVVLDPQMLGHTLSRLPRLSKLSSVRNVLNEKILGEMFPPSSTLRALQVLDLSENHIQDIAGFGTTLSETMPMLEELGISSNFVKGPSIVEFISGLPPDSKLRILELGGNCISRDDAVEIVSSAMRLPSFQVYGLVRQRGTYDMHCRSGTILKN